MIITEWIRQVVSGSGVRDGACVAFVARFEPTVDMKEVRAAVEAAL